MEIIIAAVVQPIVYSRQMIELRFVYIIVWPKKAFITFISVNYTWQNNNTCGFDKYYLG